MNASNFPFLILFLIISLCFIYHQQLSSNFFLVLIIISVLYHVNIVQFIKDLSPVVVGVCVKNKNGILQMKIDTFQKNITELNHLLLSFNCVNAKTYESTHFTQFLKQHSQYMMKLITATSNANTLFENFALNHDFASAKEDLFSFLSDLEIYFLPMSINQKKKFLSIRYRLVSVTNIIHSSFLSFSSVSSL